MTGADRFRARRRNTFRPACTFRAVALDGGLCTCALVCRFIPCRAAVGEPWGNQSVLCSNGAAPITAVASASISSW